MLFEKNNILSDSFLIIHRSEREVIFTDDYHILLFGLCQDDNIVIKS